MQFVGFKSLVSFSDLGDDFTPEAVASYKLDKVRLSTQRDTVMHKVPF